MSADIVSDVGPLVPEARLIVQRIVQLYWEQFGAQIVGILVHGSALKGGYISGCSDIDFQIYVGSGVLDEFGGPPLEQALAIGRAQATLDIAPFQYIQAYIMAVHTHNERFKGFVGPIAGAYHMVYGHLPIPEATDIQLLADAHRTLERIPLWFSETKQRLLEHGRVERNTRWLCTVVWPVLYSVIVLQSEPSGVAPSEIWRMPKTAVLAMLPRQEMRGRLIWRFYQCVLEYYSADEQKIEGALAVIEQGMLFLQVVTQWYEGYRKQG